MEAVARAAVHPAPGAEPFAPAPAERLHGSEAAGDVRVLLVHGGAPSPAPAVLLV